MNLPFLNPNKFYKPAIKKNIDTMAFSDYVDFRNSSKEHFKQSFLGYARNIYYNPFVRGDYGFTDENVTIINDPLADKQTKILLNVIELGSYTIAEQFSVEYSLGNSFIGETLIIKSNYPLDVSLSSSSGSVFLLNQIPFDGLIKITLPLNFTKLKVQIRSDFALSNDVEIKGIAIVEDALGYKFNGLNRTSKLIDISQFGAVYLITSESETTFLPVPMGSNPEYSDIIRKYKIVGRMDPLNSGEKFVITMQGAITQTQEFHFEDVTITPLGGLANCYDWISYNTFPESGPGMNDEHIILELAHYRLLSWELRDASNNVLYSYPITSEGYIVDSEYWYLGGQSEIQTNLEEAYAEIVGVIRAKTINDASIYLPYNKEIESDIGNQYFSKTDISNFPAFLKITNAVNNGSIFFDEISGELVKIKKIAQIRPLVSCATFEIDGNVSEPFEILSLEQSIDRKLLNIEYSHFEDFQGMAFDNFNGAMLLPFYLESDDTQEVTVFNGQQTNVTRGSENLKTEAFTNYLPIPVYLKVKLQMIFNFDDIKIDGTDYGIIDKAESEQLETSLMYNFNIKVREDNFNY